MRYMNHNLNLDALLKQLLIRSSDFFFDLCGVTGTNWVSPKNPGKIDKRQPMWVPFMAEMKRIGPLTLGKDQVL